MYVLMIYPRTTHKAWINWKRHNLMPCYHIFIRYGFHVQSTKKGPVDTALSLKGLTRLCLTSACCLGQAVAAWWGPEEFCAVLSREHLWIHLWKSSRLFLVSIPSGNLT